MDTGNVGKSHDGSVLPMEIEALESKLRKTVSRDLSRAPTAVSGKHWLKRQFTLASLIAVLSVLSYFLFSSFFLCAVLVQGRSMEPTLQDGAMRLLDRISYYCRSPDRGDLVVLRDPGHSDYAIKRVVALPGESVDIRAGRLYVNGRPAAEPYLAQGTRTDPLLRRYPLRLGPEQYFVLGDNRHNSEDSRVYGPIHRRHMLGCLLD